MSQAPPLIALARPTVGDLARLGGARSLVCYGGRDLQIRAFRRPFSGDGIAMAAGSPEWINGVFGGDALLDREANWGDETALEIYGRAHPSLLDSGTEYFGCDDAAIGWFDVTGHFDDPISSDCRFTYADPRTDEPVDEEPALSVLDCRPKYHDANGDEDQDANGRDQGDQREDQEPIRQPANRPGDVAPGKPFRYRWWLPRHLVQFASC